MSALRRVAPMALLLAVALPLAVATTSAPAFAQTGAYPQLQQQGLKLLGTGATGLAQQGGAVALSADGNTAIVGGPADNSNVGGAWIFIRSGATWTQQGNELVGTGATGGAQQGKAVAISGDGNTAIVGGPTDNGNAGAVWIFTRSAGVWSQQGAKLLGTGAVGGANQGTTVAISADGNTAVLGGPNNDSGDGGVWIFTRSAGVWSQQGGKLFGSGNSGDGVSEGGAVAISGGGNTILFGAAFDNSNIGAFWFFTRTGVTWTQLGSKLVAGGSTGAANQGSSVALSADGLVAAIGGPSDNSGTGAIWTYAKTAGTWTQRSTLAATFTDAVGAARIGSSVAASGDGAVIASGGIGDATNQGAVFVFQRTGVSSWAELGRKLVPSDVTAAGKFGASVGLSADGNSGFFGAVADTSNAGAAWPYNSNIFFGSANVSSPVTQTITVLSQGGFSISASPGVVVSTQGAPNFDFTMAASQPVTNNCHAGGAFQGQFKTCSINVQFSPSAPGIRTGAIQFFPNEGNVVTVYLYGVGLAPQVGFSTAQIDTFAGDGTGGYSGDGGAAPAAELDFTDGTFIDPHGNVFIADFNNNVIRGVGAQTGNITTVAGIAGAGSYSGDTGPANAAHLNGPETPQLDGAGNLFFVESNSFVVRKVQASNGIISTLAGNGSPGYTGDGGIANSARMNNPFAIAMGNTGDIYIADFSNNVVRRISALTGIITTVAAVSQPTALAIDTAGNLYISDGNNSVVLELAAGTGVISTVVGDPDLGGTFSGDGGLALSAGLNDIEGMAFSPAGDLYVTDSVNNAVRKINVTTGIINSIAGDGNVGSEDYTGDGGPATAALLAFPSYPEFDTFGDLFFSDSDNNVVRAIHGAASLDFATVNVAATSAAQDVTVTNNGNAPLSFTALTADTGFDLNGADTTCTSSTILQPGESCVLGVEFAPIAGGSIDGNITLTDNAGEQAFSVSGIGAAITPTITLTVLPASPNQNQSVTLTAVLDPVPASPFGTVNFCDITTVSDISRGAGSARGMRGRPSPMPADGIFANCDAGTLLGSGNVDETGTATFATTALSSGAHMIIAVYSGNEGLNEALSNIVTETISSLQNTTTSLSADPNSASVGQTVTFTATITPAPTGSPLGSINFCLGSLSAVAPAARTAGSAMRARPVPAGPPPPCGGATLLQNVVINASGVATFTTSSLAVGSNLITAVYSGNTGFAGSVSNTINEIVSTNTPTSTALTVTPNPADSGAPVTLTATVTPTPTGSPLGSVSFCLGSLDVVAPTARPIGGTISGSAVGTPPASARRVRPLPATSACFGATVLMIVTINASGVATFTTSSLAVGSVEITAIYSGNAGFAVSISNTVTEVINASTATPTQTALTVSPNPADAGATVTLTATVTPTPTGSPLGTITFCVSDSNDAVHLAGARTHAATRGSNRAPVSAPAEGPNVCGSASVLNITDLDASGTAIFTDSTLAVGSPEFAAVYSGNATFGASTSESIVETINTAFEVTAPPAPVDVDEGGAVDIDITVPPLGGAFNSPVTMSATGLPPGATATFNPPIVTPGADGVQTMMTVTLAGAHATVSPDRNTPLIPGGGRGIGLLASMFLLAGIFATRYRRGVRTLAALSLLFLAVSGSMLLLSGCSGGFAGAAVTPKGQYVITVTGTSGALSASTTVTLVVK